MKARESVEKMQEYLPPLEGRGDLVRLDFNENTLGPCKGIARVLKNIKPEFLSVYPEYSELTRAIATYNKISKEWILPCNGSDETIRLAINCFVEKRQEIIILEPSFSMFGQYAEALGAKIKEIRYKGDLSFPVEDVLNAINRKTRMIILCNPNNPTGTVIEKNVIERIVRKAVKAVVFVDEAYYEFCGSSCINLVKKYENLIISRTLSKAFGLAGLRIGYAVSNEKNIKLLRRVSSPYSVSSVSAKIAIAALGKNSYMKRYIGEIRESKTFFERELKKRKIKYFSSKGNFVLVYLGENCRKICRELRKRGILIRDRSTFPMLDGCARITIGTKGQMKLLLREIDGIMRKPLLIFDIDGVLIDVSKSYRKAIQGTVEYFTGRKISQKEIQERKNSYLLNNDWDLSQRLIEVRGFSVNRARVVDKFQQLYLGKNFDGLIKNERLLIEKGILEKLGKNYTLCILTGRPRREADYALKLFGIKDSFEMIVAMEDIPKNKQKPNPFGLKKIVNAFDAGKACYLGDTTSDILCSINAGVEAIGVLPPQDKSKKLRREMLRLGAKIVLGNCNEILEVIEKDK